jgi:hypothetical protein
MGATGDENLQDRRLDSWKEIATFFGRDERTVKRWEARRGLPVRRVPGGGKPTVYAYVGELNDWLRHGGGAEMNGAAAALGGQGADATTEPGSPGLELSSSGLLRRLPETTVQRVLAGVLAIAAIVAVAVAAEWFTTKPDIAHSANVAAYSYYLKGLYSWQTRTPAGLAQAIDDFNKSIADDPNFASAYSGLADCYNLMPEFTNMPAAIAFPRAKSAAERAIALDGNLADAHRSLGFVDFWWSHDVPGAMREFKRALELSPKSAQTHHWYANVLAGVGDDRDALTEISTAEDLSPGTSAIQADKGLILADERRLDEAAQILRQVETAEPEFAPAHAYLGFVYGSQGNGPGELREMRIAAELKHDAKGLAVVTAGEQGYAAGGFREMTRRMAARKHELSYP